MVVIASLAGWTRDRNTVIALALFAIVTIGVVRTAFHGVVNGDVPAVNPTGVEMATILRQKAPLLVYEKAVGGRNSRDLIRGVVGGAAFMIPENCNIG